MGVCQPHGAPWQKRNEHPVSIARVDGRVQPARSGNPKQVGPYRRHPATCTRSATVASRGADARK
ncbi:hypothetical protein EAO72_10755 [Streptomyces sp. or43]|nr:hypothetical protein EAO72_10755 [Streptomyces sp. or43]